MSPNKSSPARKANEAMAAINLLGLVRETWRLVKARRSLWFLGILAGLSQGYGLSPQFAGRFDQRLDLNLWQEQFSGFAPFLVFAFPILLILWLASLITEAGLMKAVLEAKEGKSPTFRRGFSEGRPFLWPLVKLNLFLALISLGLALLAGVPALQIITTSSPGLGLLSGAIGAGIFTAYGILLALLYPWMTRFLVLKKSSVRDSISLSWKLFRHLPWSLIKIGLVGILLQVVLSVLLVLALLIVIIPLALLVQFSTSDPGSATLVLGPILVLLILVALLFAGFITALKNAYYTLAFQKLAPDS